MRSLISRRLVTSLAAAGLLAAGAVGAFAANAELPDQASDNAKSKVAEQPTDDTGDDELTADVTTQDGEDNHGKVVSTFAHETELEGCERGQAVASVARGDLTPEEAETADFSEKCDRGDDADANLITTEGDEEGDDDEPRGKGAEISEEHRGDGGASGTANADERSGGKRGGPHTDED